MASVTEIENCYKYILGRTMADEEVHYVQTAGDALAAIPVDDLRRDFFRSEEFHGRYLETVFENLVPKSKIVAYDTELGFRIYLDLRQLHLSFGVLNEIYERHEIDILRQLIPDHGTFFDIGANCGYYSLAIASRPGFAGSVVAFEPLPSLHDLFRRSVGENGLDRRIIVHQVALGHKRGTLPLTDAESTINAGATELAIGEAPAGSRVVAVETLDHLAERFSPDVMKIDVQGAEALMIHGGARTIEKHQPTMLFGICPETLHRVSRAAPQDLQHWLTDRGYKLWTVEADRLKPISNDDNLGNTVSHSDVVSVLAVHDGRMHDVRSRLGGLL